MPEKETIKTGLLSRHYDIKKDTIDEENRSFEISFSSEEPYERWFGMEILDHKKGSIDLSFIGSGRAPLLLDHDMRKQIGVIESAKVVDRRGRAVVRFGKGELADEIFQDVLDGIRSNISVGYNVRRMELVSSDEKEGDVYRVVDWVPLESSIVSIPADPTVGVGRSGDNEVDTIIIKSAGLEKDPEPTKPKEVKKVPKTPEEIKTETDLAVKAGIESAQKDVSAIMSLGETHGFQKDAAKFIGDGKSPGDFKSFVLEALEKRGLKPVAAGETNYIGLNDSEIKRFSVIKAINALANPNSKEAREAASFELEASAAVAVKTGKEARGFFIPAEVQARDLTVGSDPAGGYTVETGAQGQSMIELLRNRMMVERMGARTLDGLIGDIAIPKMTGGATAYWVAESGDVTESSQTFGQLSMVPKTVGAVTDISRKLLLQSSIDVEGLVNSDLATALAIEIDRVAIEGSGSANQPTGILSTSGIGSIVGATNGAAPDWDDVVNLWGAVAVDNADFGATGYLVNSNTVSKFMRTAKISSTDSVRIMNEFPGADGMTTLAGARCGVSNQVPADLTKGSGTALSAIIYGNWTDLIIAMWGTLDILVDPYTGGLAGTVRVIAHKDVDVGVRHPESFAAMQDAITT